MFAADRRLFVIGQNERSSRILARDMRLLCGVEFKGLDQGVITPTIKPDAVVLGGVPLTDAAVIRKVERALRPFLTQQIPVLCLMDNPTTRDEVQAMAVGATSVLTTAAPFRAIADQIQVLLRSRGGHTVRQQAALRTAVEDVTCSLADLLIAAGSGRAVKPTLAAEAGALLLQALAGDGLANWMQAVGHVHDSTYRHSLAIGGIMGAFVLNLGFNPRDCQRMVSAALLHDIGKALVPIEIIDKPGALTVDEMEVMKSHPMLGHDLLVAQGGHDDLALDVVRSHHECLDGSGYPDRLQGDRITDPVRIASICDVFAALIEPRAYKPSIEPLRALDIMAGMTGKLDMTLLKAFRNVFVG